MPYLDITAFRTQIYQIARQRICHADSTVLRTCRNRACHIHRAVEGYTSGIFHLYIKVALRLNGICYMQITIASRKRNITPGRDFAILLNNDIPHARRVCFFAS